MRRMPALEVVSEELEAAGVPFTWEPTRNNHLKVLWIINGKPRTYVVQRSRSEPRAIKNARSDVRRMLRQDGALA